MVCEGRLKTLELFCSEELGPTEVGSLPKKLEVLGCGARPSIVEACVVVTGVKLTPDPLAVPCATLPVGGSPAGVVETPPEEKKPLGLPPAGVELTD